MPARAAALLVVIAGTSVPAIVAWGSPATAQLSETTTTTTTSTTTTTAPGGTATEDATTTTTGSTTSTTTPPAGAGALTISVPGAADLSTGTPVAAGRLSAPLGEVTVTDGRTGLVAGWTASVSATDFVTGGGTAAETIPRANLAYWSGPATATQGTATFGPGQATEAAAQPLATSVVAFSALTTAGGTSATWTPTLIVTFPANAVSGQYRGTITHSVA